MDIEVTTNNELRWWWNKNFEKILEFIKKGGHFRRWGSYVRNNIIESHEQSNKQHTVMCLFAQPVSEFENSCSVPGCVNVILRKRSMHIMCPRTQTHKHRPTPLPPHRHRPLTLTLDVVVKVRCAEHAIYLPRSYSQVMINALHVHRWIFIPPLLLINDAEGLHVLRRPTQTSESAVCMSLSYRPMLGFVWPAVQSYLYLTRSV